MAGPHRRIWTRMKDSLLRNQQQTPSASPPNADNAKQLCELSSIYTIVSSDSKKECREKLKLSFERNRVTVRVTEMDLIAGVDDSEQQDPLHRGQLILPRSEKRYGSSTVPNCCVVCLESYIPGDLVVWSCNSDCQHAMHQSCVLKYLVHIQKKAGMTPCCVCRCNFTDLEVQRGERHIRRRGRGGRRTVRTQHNFDALALPSWWTSSSARRHR